MIRLPATQAAITAPLVASSTSFPGIPIGRSLTDGRAFHLSPVLVDAAVLPATNSLALGGLGSGKSTTAKARLRREILHHDHQAVVIDSFGEDGPAGEWALLTRSLGGKVIKAGEFTLNPVSPLLPPEVREQLVRSLIAAVEPSALTHQSTHALQHALNNPKSGGLGGLVDALVSPEAGRWPAPKLAEWGEGAAIALSRYTEGSLRGLFDGRDASLPETDLPIVSFDFSSLDRNSPAIPALMAAIACWVEHVWLPQSTAVHRHLVLEEAWQILLSPATAELIQRLLKNSRKAALSLDVVMHTLSDLGDGRAQDLARLCEIAHIGRLGPEEAAAVGALLGLPAWAIARIPALEPGQAVWKVGPGFVDVVHTTLAQEEIRLTDTSTRRRRAQEAHAGAAVTPGLETASDPEMEAYGYDDGEAYGEEGPSDGEHAALGDMFGKPHPDPEPEPQAAPVPGFQPDHQHALVLHAAAEGRYSEAADIAAIGERGDITAHGIDSPQAIAWLMTRARVAVLAGNPSQAAQLRATVARMGGNNDVWTSSTEPNWYSEGPPPPPPGADPALVEQPAPLKRRRLWPYAAAIVVLILATGGVWQKKHDDQAAQEQMQRAAAYKGRASADLQMAGVSAGLEAEWNRAGDAVTLELRSYMDPNATYLRIESAGESAESVKKGYHLATPEISLPVRDRYADVTVKVTIGGKAWTQGAHTPTREIRLSPTGVAFDAATGDELAS
ncbi:hypothetical protein [Streptomyces sp. NPDC058579]|uniref:hypothetical protein n=1 Tax=Streptomyces sp. NPDC058579 TaxID=3346548 RepID=UPI0036671274